MKNKTPLLPYEISGVVGTSLGCRLNYKEFLFENYYHYNAEPPERFKLEFLKMKSLIVESFNCCVKTLTL